MMKVFKQKSVLTKILFFVLVMLAFFCLKTEVSYTAIAAGTENAVIYRNGEAVEG